MKKKEGFTLAEVLVTLTIIGVIAALTIPSLITSFQNYTYATRLEKFFSTANAGFKKMMLDKGCSDIPCTGILNANTTVTMTNIQNTGVFNVVKRCDLHQTGCHDAQVYYLNNNQAWVPSTAYPLFVTSDGMTWGIHISGALATDCSYNVGSGSLANCCINYGFVDVNGPAPPNKFGRDVYRFYLLSDGRVVPVGMDNDTAYGPWSSAGAENCNNTNGFGQGCAARVAQEGWKINY